ncbi:MAG: nucleotidyltransferase family protein [Burkholderiaceae bacterium]|nr:nucleotidyltransferase family protein [Burkholderiaceae bacterium]
MRAMILAAGRGERMRPLTDTCPKPLLQVGGKALIVWHLEALARAGLREVVINHAHLGNLIGQELGDGSNWGVQISYSPEAQALETAGGIVQALELLGPEPFLVVNGDVFCDFDFSRTPGIASEMIAAELLAWCLLVANPEHHRQGDFALHGARLAGGTDPAQLAARLTFSGIGVYRPELFAGIVPGSRAALAPLLYSAAASGRAGGELHKGRWTDVGTHERLRQLDAQLRGNGESQQ